jgi:hypothetical protein
MNMIHVGLCAFILDVVSGLNYYLTLVSCSFTMLWSIGFLNGASGKLQDAVLGKVEICSNEVMNSEDIIFSIGSVVCFLFFILMTSATIMVGAFYLRERTINSLSHHQKKALHKFNILFRIHVVIGPLLILGVIWLFLTAEIMRSGLLFVLLGLIQLPLIMYMMTRITHLWKDTTTNHLQEQ